MVAGTAAAKSKVPDQAWFQKNTQALFDALAPGDKKVWDKALASDCIISDEDGKVQTKAELLKDFSPLPAGSSGSIQVEDLKVQDLGGTAAVVHYIIDEQEDVQGQRLHTKYHHHRRIPLAAGWLEDRGEPRHGGAAGHGPGAGGQDRLAHAGG